MQVNAPLLKPRRPSQNRPLDEPTCRLQCLVRRDAHVRAVPSLTIARKQRLVVPPQRNSVSVAQFAGGFDRQESTGAMVLADYARAQ